MLLGQDKGPGYGTFCTTFLQCNGSPIASGISVQWQYQKLTDGSTTWRNVDTYSGSFDGTSLTDASGTACMTGFDISRTDPVWDSGNSVFVYPEEIRYFRAYANYTNYSTTFSKSFIVSTTDSDTVTMLQLVLYACLCGAYRKVDQVTFGGQTKTLASPGSYVPFAVTVAGRKYRFVPGIPGAPPPDSYDRSYCDSATAFAGFRVYFTIPTGADMYNGWPLEANIGTYTCCEQPDGPFGATTCYDGQSKVWDAEGDAISAASSGTGSRLGPVAPVVTCDPAFKIEYDFSGVADVGRLDGNTLITMTAS